MTESPSEDYLSVIAEKTFLRIWVYPNTFYKSGKELTDLIVPFGDDVIIISDKAINFQDQNEINIAWPRWYRKAIKESVTQLKSVKRRIDAKDEEIYVDEKATRKLPFSLGPKSARRYHFIAIARPRHNPEELPENWTSFQYSNENSKDPFIIGPVFIDNIPVHVFDGPTIDLLLDILNTTPDFIAYLKGRAERLISKEPFNFREEDLLAESILNWVSGDGLSPCPPPLNTVKAGAWEKYQKSERKRLSDERNLPSLTIDLLIKQNHEEYINNRFIGEQPNFSDHEFAMRLLASESRFSRRMIATSLYDLWAEPNRKTFWASTLPSPTTKALRYVWLVYPEPPISLSTTDFDKYMKVYLRKHILVARALFDETCILGVALPNREVTEVARFIELLDGLNWSDDDQEKALQFQKNEAIFSDLTKHTFIHVP